MKYSFTTTALVGVILAVTSSATPISQQTSSSTISTPSFGPKYHTNDRGPFTDLAALETHAPASYRTYDFHGFGLGQVIPETPLPVVSTSLSTSVRRTPTKMHGTGSSTPTALFPNFHPHFGHGPVVSGRGSNSSYRNSNSTKPEAPASFPRPFKSPVHWPWQPHNELPPPANGTTQRVPKSSSFEDHKVYCEKHWVKMTFVCEKGMRVNRWWHGDRNHTKPHTHHNKPLKSLQGRSIHLSPRASEVTPTASPTHFSTSKAPKASVTAIPAATNLFNSQRTQHEVNLKIVEANSKIEFYKKQVGRANQEMRQLEIRCQHACDDIGLTMHKVEVVKAYNMEQLEHAREEMARLQASR
jgi:hypothetical protein